MRRPILVGGPLDVAGRLCGLLREHGWHETHAVSLDETSAAPRLVAIDPRARRARVERRGRVFDLAYERVALAAVPVFGPIAGLFEHSVDILDPRNRAWARARVASLPRRVRAEHRSDRRAALINVAILGAGRRGIEFACELVASSAGRQLGIALIDGNERILPELPTADEDRIVADLSERGILVLRGFEPEAVTASEVRFSGGVRIPTRTILRAEPWTFRPGWSCIPVGGLDVPLHGIHQSEVVDLAAPPRSEGLYTGFGAPDETWYRQAVARITGEPVASGLPLGIREAWLFRGAVAPDIAHLGNRSLAGPVVRLARTAIGRWSAWQLRRALARLAKLPPTPGHTSEGSSLATSLHIRTNPVSILPSTEHPV